MLPPAMPQPATAVPAPSIEIAAAKLSVFILLMNTSLLVLPMPPLSKGPHVNCFGHLPDA